MATDTRGKLADIKIPINLRLSLLWTSVMFLYIYNDYFSMYTPGTIDSMAKGQLGPMGPATGAMLAGMAILLAVPSLMITLSAVLPAWLARWLNVAVGLAYTAIEGMTLLGSPLFYKIVVTAEIILTALIVVGALRWPRHAASP